MVEILVFSDFGNLFDPDYGNCYTFNYQTEYNSTRAGVNRGGQIFYTGCDKSSETFFKYSNGVELPQKIMNPQN